MSPHLIDSWRAVATAKIEEFSYQCERLADLAEHGAVNRSEAASCLHDIASAHSLYETFGADYIINMVAEVFVESAASVEAAAA